MIKKHNLKETTFLLILIIFIFLSSKAILHSGFFRTVDDLTTVRIDYLYKEIKEGNWLNNFPVRISGKLANNYGYPLYLFYAPLVYYGGAFLMFLGKSHIVATKFVYIFPLIIGPLIFYFAARQKLQKLPALTASIFFSLFPYRGYDIYIRGDAPEAWATAFIPLVFLGLFMMEKEKNKQLGGLFFSFGMFLVILSHQLTGALIIVFVILYGIFFLIKNKFFWQYLILSFGLAAFYLLPMIYYLKIVKVTYLKENTYGILKNLISYNKLLSFNFNINQETKFLAIDIYVIIFGLIFLILNFDRKISSFFWGIIGLFFYLLMFDISFFIWKIALPIVGILQFPWRLLILISFIYPFFMGIIINKIKNNLIKLVISLLLIIYSLSFLSIFKPYQYSYFYEYKPEGPCATVSHENEFLPIWVKKCASYNDKFLDFNKKNKLKIYKQKSTFIEAKIKTNEPGDLIVNKYYFPGWEVYIDGKKQKVDYNFSPYGLFKVFINKGEHYIKVFYKKTLIMWISDFISLFSWLIFFVLMFRNLKSMIMINFDKAS